MKKYKNFSKTHRPTKSECIKILENYNTPVHVKNHCIAVGKVAGAIASALNKKGLELDEDLVLSAGYLHDIARVHKVHEKVGSEYLVSIGLTEVAEVMKNHTKHKISRDIQSLNEEDVLCIADRLVLEDRYVGAKKRMDYIMSKAILKFGEENKARLDEIRDDFISFVLKLEEFLGESIEDLVEEQFNDKLL